LLGIGPDIAAYDCAMQVDFVEAMFNHPDAVQARAEIDTVKGDREFGAKLLNRDAYAMKRWTDLHGKGWPRPPSIASEADVNQRQAGRHAEAWNGYINAIRRDVLDLTDVQETEIRAGVCNKQSHDWAVNTKQQCLIRTRHGEKSKMGARL
jgi:hypothetical protein